MEVRVLRLRRAVGAPLVRAFIHSLLVSALLFACGDNRHKAEHEPHDPSADGGELPPGLGDDGGVDASDTSGLDGAMPEPDGAMPEPDAGPLAPPAPVDGADETLALFDGAHVYFTGAENQRELNRQVELPGDNFQYSSITLTLALRCPTGGCDAWARRGHLAIVLNPDTPQARELEILRFATPYGRDMSTSLDVTDLRPLLTGRVATRVFIDTWVGPGHTGGAGWLVDAKLSFAGGPAPRDVVAVAPLWSPEGVVYGDPSRSPERSTTVGIPEGVSGVKVWANITGHGSGNSDNCAEFCPGDHTLHVAGQSFTRSIWRTDCATTAVPDQTGTWKYERAGWCPGAIVHPWTEDVTAAVGGGMSLEVSWSPQAYENSCRPGVASCSGCVSGTGCDYDGGAHTEPHYQLSAMLLMYR